MFLPNKIKLNSRDFYSPSLVVAPFSILCIQQISKSNLTYIPLYGKQLKILLLLG